MGVSFARRAGHELVTSVTLTFLHLLFCNAFDICLALDLIIIIRP
jgi:hypothetical protein